MLSVSRYLVEKVGIDCNKEETAIFVLRAKDIRKKRCKKKGARFSVEENVIELLLLPLVNLNRIQIFTTLNFEKIKFLTKI